ncbi:MAG: YgjP-like metallopeptidase domain-containing protein [Candidatus Peregrinibacteria bacterium]
MMLPSFSSRTVSSDDHSVVIQIERTRNRHSRATLRDDTIVVRLGKNLSRKKEQDHIRSLVERMTKRVLKERTKPLIDPFRPLLNGASTAVIRLASQKEITITIAHSPGRSRILRQRSGWIIRISPAVQKSALHRMLWNILAKQEEDAVHSIVGKINRDSINAPLRSLRLRYLSSRWGSCSRSGSVTLNAALLFVPEHLFTYVVVHELAHRIHPNHSASFWKCVSKAYPAYREARRMLAQFRLLQKL